MFFCYIRRLLEKDIILSVFLLVLIFINILPNTQNQFYLELVLYY